MRFLLLFLLSSSAFGQGTVSSTCVWSGSVADCLPSGGLLLRNQRDLRLGEANANGSNYVALQAPAALAANVTLSLPADDGDAGEVLGTNGSGDLDWTLINNANVGASAAIAGSKIVTATTSVAGVVDTSAQSLAGVKTFADGLVLDNIGGQTTLTSYIESTFTPSPAAVNDVISIGAVSNARYTKIGRIVFFEFIIASVQLNATSSSHIVSFTLPIAAAASDVAMSGSASWYSTGTINARGNVNLQAATGAAGSTTAA